jgi:antitoxin VapB
LVEEVEVALSIKNPEVERLIAEVAALSGASKTEAVRQALVARRRELQLSTGRRPRGAQFLRYLSEEVWPVVPADQLGRRLSRDEEDEILGLGRHGV